MKELKAITSQLNVLTARVNQFKNSVDHSTEKIKAFIAPIENQIKKLEAERDSLKANDCEVECETVKPSAV